MTGIYGVMGGRSGDSQESVIFKQHFDESPLLPPPSDKNSVSSRALARDPLNLSTLF